ncbi:MAG: hypothetical protein LCH57_12265 [Proteobacteria bacterium]|nr:hypothetical protein [Pseudomonadota bacterium]
MAATITVDSIVLALMLFHRMQPMVCAARLRPYSQRPEEAVSTVAAPA